ncbi:MAG: 2-phosphosulfolactate phosphatase [Anaerolineae bacterium]
MFFDQFEFDVRCEWGGHGVAVLAPHCDAIVIVDVLSFSTSVDVATQRGALVFPYQGGFRQAANFAASVNAHLAERHRSHNRFSLSPESLMRIPAGTRIVLPSPNGATLSLAANRTPVLAGCLRNAQAVARAAQKFGSQIAVIPAGERWPADQSLRPCFEDLVGAGAIISYLSGRLAPEAAIALAAFQSVQPALDEHLMRCSSGKELIERGYTEDVRLAAQLNASDSAPILRNGAFVRAGDQK